MQDPNKPAGVTMPKVCSRQKVQVCQASLLKALSLAKYLQGEKAPSPLGWQPKSPTPGTKTLNEPRIVTCKWPCRRCAPSSICRSSSRRRRPSPMPTSSPLVKGTAARPAASMVARRAAGACAHHVQLGVCKLAPGLGNGQACMHCCKNSFDITRWSASQALARQHIGW